MRLKYTLPLLHHYQEIQNAERVSITVTRVNGIVGVPDLNSGLTEEFRCPNYCKRIQEYLLKIGHNRLLLRHT